MGSRFTTKKVTSTAAKPSWFLFTNVDAAAFVRDGNDICYAARDGRVCAFYDNFFDFGRAIEREYRLPPQAFGGYELFEPGKTDDLVLDITTSANVPAVVSFYELDGKRFVAIVNNSTTEDSQMLLYVTDQVKSVKQWNFHRQLVPLRGMGHENGRYIGGDWHFPGQMKLYCIES